MPTIATCSTGFEGLSLQAARERVEGETRGSRQGPAETTHALRWTRAAPTPTPSGRRDVPRDGSRCRAVRHLPRPRGLSRPARAAPRRRRALRMAHARLLPDAEPLPPRSLGITRAALLGHAQTQLPLRDALQPALRAPWPPVPEPLRRPRGRGGPSRALRLRVRGRQPGPGRSLPGSKRLAVVGTGPLRPLAFPS